MVFPPPECRNEQFKIKVMRKITESAVEKFMAAKEFKSGNTEIEVLPNVTIMKLHGNLIAYRYNDPQRTLSVTNAGWFTNVTKERLNGLPGVRVNQSKGKWYLNGKEWNGDLTDVKL